MPIVCPFQVNLGEPKPLHEMITEHFDQYGDKVALEEYIDDESPKLKLTFREVLQIAKNVAHNLQQVGFKKSDVVAVYMENRIQFAPLFLAISSLGGSVTGVNPLYTVEELHRQLDDSGATFLFTKRLLLPKARKSCEGLAQPMRFMLIDGIDKNESNCLDFQSLCRGTFAHFPKVYIECKEDVVVLPYSSGTTGLPKGVMLTHTNLAMLFFSRHSLGAFHVNDQSVVTVMFMPFFHAAGLFALIFALTRGNTGVVMTKFEPVKYLELVVKHKATFIFCVPSVLVFLTKNKMVEKFDLSHVKTIAFGAAPAGKELIEALKRKFPNVTMIQQGYGMTESGGMTTINPALSVDKYLLGSCGIPVPNTEIKVISTDGKNTELGPMQTGEICIRGPSIMKGYMKNEKATKETIDENGWLHSGDLGYYDHFAHVYIVDRLKELIKYKGLQIAPAEVEDVILKHPSIQEVGVVGMNDVTNQDVGELTTAFVVLKQGFVPSKQLEQSIKDTVSEHLAPYKQLRGGVKFCNELPKGPSGKIMRRLLREQKVKIDSRVLSVESKL